MAEEKLELDEKTLRAKLTPEQYRVTQEADTERAFTGKYWDKWDDGTYVKIPIGPIATVARTTLPRSTMSEISSTPRPVSTSSDLCNAPSPSRS